MTEQEAKWYLLGDRVLSPDGPTIVFSIDEYDPHWGYWQVVTRDSNGHFGYWICSSSLKTTLGFSAADAFRRQPSSAIPAPQECAQTDLLDFPEHKPTDAPRPLCPAEGERETIDWEAHRRFMRGLG